MLVKMAVCSIWWMWFVWLEKKHTLVFLVLSLSEPWSSSFLQWQLFPCLHCTSVWNSKHLYAKDLHIVKSVCDRSLETRKQLWKAVLLRARAQHLKRLMYLLSAYLNPPAHPHQALQAHQNLHYHLLCLHQPKQACQIQPKPVQGRVEYQFQIFLLIDDLITKKSCLMCRTFYLQRPAGVSTLHASAGHFAVCCSSCSSGLPAGLGAACNSSGSSFSFSRLSASGSCSCCSAWSSCCYCKPGSYTDSPPDPPPYQTACQCNPQ